MDQNRSWTHGATWAKCLKVWIRLKKKRHLLAEHIPFLYWVSLREKEVEEESF